ncbi:MAG: hypothetical protein HY235_26930 [Acidobacteria bacterium]|nr:hypothetical protein [Acidobacteriota bacterium]
MLRRVAALLSLCAAALPAALLTDNLGAARRVSLEKPKLTGTSVWEEYGLAEAEAAAYEGGAGPFTVTAWQMKDPTGAQAAFRWIRPEKAKPGNPDALAYTRFAVTFNNGMLMTYGNYLLRFEGRLPELEELRVLLFQLPKVDQSSLPPLLDYLPEASLAPASDRYILGPASLEKFFPKVPPSAVAFHFGAEGVVGRYLGRSSETEMAIFYYPTNSMARERQQEFEKLNGAMVKRSGPLVAVIFGPHNRDDAERLLALVNYKAQITLHEALPGSTFKSAGSMLLSIFLLTGLLIALCVAAGFMVFGMRLLRRRMAGGKDEEIMTLLHLADRTTEPGP